MSSRRRRTYVQVLARYLGSQKMMSAVHHAHGAAWGNQQGMLQHRIFFILDLCDAIGQLGVFSVRYIAAQTPTWVGLGAEGGDTDGFWGPKFFLNAGGGPGHKRKTLSRPRTLQTYLKIEPHV